MEVWQTGFMLDLGMVFVDNWMVGKEKGCYWLNNDIVGLVGSLAM